MKFILLLLTLIITEVQAQNTQSPLVRGLIIDVLPLPECVAQLSGYIHIKGSVIKICNGSEWEVIAVDSDGDGITKLFDEDDNDATDKGDSDLVPSNIKRGVNILGVAGTLNPGSSHPTGSNISIPRISPGVSAYDKNHSIPNALYTNKTVNVRVDGDADLISSNIRSGKNIFGVSGSYSCPTCPTCVTCPPQRGDFSLGTFKSTTSNQNIVRDVPDGSYSTGDDVTFTIMGDRDLKAGNIKSGVNILGVAGSYSCTTCPPERGDFSLGSFQSTATNQTIVRDIPDGSYGTGDDVKFTITGDTDLIPLNIKSGINLFGVTGTYTGPRLPDGRNIVLPAIRPQKDSRVLRYDIPRGYYDGTEDITVTVFGDGYLVPANIRTGISIFGVSGILNCENCPILNTLPERSHIVVGEMPTPLSVDKDYSRSIPTGIYRTNDYIRYTIGGDANLVPGNIKRGVTIFGVTGTY